ncbi:TPA: HAD family hydrolase [bacterium]|nr:HAD family hydrolase [bacterium]
MIKAVIFDMDGLMVDTEPLYSRAVIEIAKKKDKEFTLEIKQKMMGRLGIESMQIFKEHLNLPESPKELLEERAKIYDNFLRKEGVKPMEGLFELLALLDSLNIPYAIASSSRRIWIDFILENLNIKNRFVSIISGDEIEKGKPDPEIYIKTIQKMDVLPENTLVLEDAPAGVISAKNAGCKCIAVRNEYTSDLEFKEADLIVLSLLEITEDILQTL